MRAEQLATPWEQRSQLYSVPGSLIVKLVPGEVPDSVPSALDVGRGVVAAANEVGVGAVDRLLKRFSDHLRVTRVHSAASSLGSYGRGHLLYDGLEHTLGLSRTLRVDMDRAAPIGDLVLALREAAHVDTAHPQYVSVTPFAVATAAAAPPLGLEGGWLSRDQVNAEAAMAYETGDPAVIAAVCDTGVSPRHPEWDPAHMRRGWDTVHLTAGDLSGGMHVLDTHRSLDAEPDDFEVGHGTACFGIIGAFGARIPPGIAGDCSLLAVRVLAAAHVPGRRTPVGIGAIADIDQGVKMAIDLGAKVLNLSFGTPASALAAGDPLPHSDVVQYGLARGCVLIAASGNSGRPEVYSPAALDGVIAVGAASLEDRPCGFSTSGDHVALCAPGERVLTTGLDSSYQSVSGTSFAAPFVTAAATLMVSRALRRAFPLDGAACRRLLVETARPWAQPRAVVGHGAGVLDVLAALQALDREIDRGGRTND